MRNQPYFLQIETRTTKAKRTNFTEPTKAFWSLVGRTCFVEFTYIQIELVQYMKNEYQRKKSYGKFITRS